MTKLSFSLLVIFSNFKCFLQHNSKAANNCPCPLSNFHIHTLAQLTQLATICSPLIQAHSNGTHLHTTLVVFFSTVVGYSRKVERWKEVRECVFVLRVRVLEWGSVCVLLRVWYGRKGGWGVGGRMPMYTPLCRDRGCRTMRKGHWKSCHIHQGGAQCRGFGRLNRELCQRMK